MNRHLTLGLLFISIICVYAQSSGKVPDIDATCMNCLCQASSNCDETLKCHNSGGGGYFCGPYVISWAYWHDGGRPGDKGRSNDFETCLSNRTCAEKAVRGYMRKYGRDCDGSGAIDCYDFARIHKLGFGSCGDESIYNTDYYEKFDICYAGYEPNYNIDGSNVAEASYNNDGSIIPGASYNNDGSNIPGASYNNDGSNIPDATYNRGGQADFADYGEGHMQARRRGHAFT